MNPKDEAKDLLIRSRRLIDAALLLIITAALLIVALGTLFCVVFVTAFTMGRNTIDQMTMRVTVEKGAAFNVLL